MGQDLNLLHALRLLFLLSNVWVCNSDSESCAANSDALCEQNTPVDNHLYLAESSSSSPESHLYSAESNKWQIYLDHIEKAKVPVGYQNYLDTRCGTGTKVRTLSFLRWVTA
jgi:hypothetical protein